MIVMTYVKHQTLAVLTLNLNRLEAPLYLLEARPGQVAVVES